MHEHDLGYKSIFSHKKTFIEFLKSFINKEWVQLINEENLVLIDKEFVHEDFREEEADIVYRGNIGGNDVIFYILMELQSKVDFRMPVRLLMYMTEIWRDELKNTEDKIKTRKDYKLPAVVPIVVYNGKNNWTAARCFKEVLNGYELFEDNIMDFRYLLFDINRMEETELLDIANVVSSIFLLDQDVEVETIIKRLKLIGRLLQNKATEEQLKILKSWLINIFKNRFDDNIKKEILNILNETSNMEVNDMVSNLGRKFEEEFNNKKQEGIKEGIKEGDRQRLINTAIKLLNKKFGAISSVQEEKIMNADMDALENLVDGIFDYKSMDDAMNMV